MTNYEWVKENQEELIRKSLEVYLRIHNDNAVSGIVDGEDIIKDAIYSKCSVDLTNNTLVMFEIPHNYNVNYLVTRQEISEWLDKEREIPLLYPIGTAVTDPDGEVWFYNGRTKYKMKHCYVGSVNKIGRYTNNDPSLPVGAHYENEEAKIYFKPISLVGLKVVDGYVNGKGDK